MFRRRPLGRLAELYSRLLHGADLSPSDEFISLILLSAAQRKSRQAHVCNAIKLHRQQTASAKQHAGKTGSGHEDGRAPPPPPSHGPSRHPSQSHGQMAQTARSLNQMGRSPSQGKGFTMEVEQTGLPEASAERPPSDARHRSHSGSESGTDGRPASPRSAEMLDQRSSQSSAVHNSSLERSDSSIGKEMQDTLSRIHTPNAPDDTQGPTQSPVQSPDSQQDRDSHVIDMPAEDHESLPPQCSASSVHGDAPAGGKVKRRSQPASSKKADVQDLKDMEEGGSCTDSQTQQKKNKSGVDSTQVPQSRMSSRRKLNQDEFFKRDFMLAPSSFACEYAPDVAPDKLADIYTGQCIRGLSSACEHACIHDCHCQARKSVWYVSVSLAGHFPALVESRLYLQIGLVASVSVVCLQDIILVHSAVQCLEFVHVLTSHGRPATYLAGKHGGGGGGGRFFHHHASILPPQRKFWPV